VALRAVYSFESRCQDPYERHEGEDLDKDEKDAESLINRLTVNISTLEMYNKDWTGVLKDFKGEVKTAEEREYARVADGDKGFIKAII